MSLPLETERLLRPMRTEDAEQLHPVYVLYLAARPPSER